MAEQNDFLRLNEILQSLVDFIRPETFVATDDLETFHELKDKVRRKSTPKQLAELQGVRSTSDIYRFLGEHSTSKGAPNNAVAVNRDELLKKLHEKHPQRPTREKDVDRRAKRKLTEEQAKSKSKSAERVKKPRPTPTQAPQTENVKPAITFGRFDFKTDDQIEPKGKKKKFQSKENKLKNTLKQMENEQETLKRLKKENPAEGKEILRSKHWQSALAKAKGEKVRDNVQLLKKTIKKQEKRKERSAKKWKTKKAETDKRMKERQDKRQTNLQKRKDEKKAKIKKRLIKKGHFENKKLMSTRQREVLRLYRDLLRYSERLKYTDVNFYLNRIKTEFTKGKSIEDEGEILRQIAKGKEFLKNQRMI